MSLFKENEKTEIKRRLSDLAGPVKLVFFKELVNCDTCDMVEGLVKELAGLSDKLTVEVRNRLIDEETAKTYGVDKVPAIVLEGPAGNRVRFYGMPSGYEFASLLESLKETAAGRADLSADTRKMLEGLGKPVRIEVFVTPTCPFCPGAVRTAHKMAVASPLVTADMVEAMEFPDESLRYGVAGVPKVIINGTSAFEGAVPENAFAAAVVDVAALTQGQKTETGGTPITI